MHVITNQYHPDSVSPPRDTLRELLEERRMTQLELAHRMGKSPKAINELLSQNSIVAITPETALQLERALGTPARFWLNRESAYRESVARTNEVERLKEHVRWLDDLPLPELRRLGIVCSRKKDAAAVREVLSFFAIADVPSWSSFWSEVEVSFRKPSSFDSKLGHLASWLRLGELLAEQIDCGEYDRVHFQAALQDVRGMTRLPVDKLCASLVDACKAAGVAVVLVPEFSKTRTSGAARWINGGRKPVICLSLRYKTDDHFWFTFFHEACHILQSHKKAIHVDDKPASGNKVEEEANEFSRNMLIETQAYEEFINSQKQISERAATAFADRLGIAPGIVVGRLQHDGLLPQSHLNKLKRRFRFDGLQLIECLD